MRRVLCAVALFAAVSARSLAFPSRTRLEAETYRYRLIEVRFPSPKRSLFAANDTVWGHLYLPRDSSGRLPPCVLVLPVMAAPNLWIEGWFVRALIYSRVAVFVVELPYQFHRTPSPLVPTGQVFLARTAGALGRNFRQAVADARRALAWLEGSGLVDKDRLGVFGLSLGALVGSSLASLEGPRPCVFLLGGADFATLVARGEMTSAFVRRMDLRQEDLRRVWQGLDPMEYREANHGKPVLLINARSDRVIPRENALKLKEAFPDSRQLWVPFGHYGAMLHLTWVPDYVAAYFAHALR